MNSKHLNEILEEDNFPYEKISKEERDLCFKFLLLTSAFLGKDATILQCNSRKEDQEYNLNGLGYLKTKEGKNINFVFNTELVVNDKSISILSTIDYLHEKQDGSVKGETIQNYNNFVKRNKKIIRQSYYGKDNKKIEFEFNISNEFDKLVDLSKYNLEDSKQR